MSRFRKKDEFIGATVTPARGNGDAIFFIDGVAELTGVKRVRERRRRRRGLHDRVEN